MSLTDRVRRRRGGAVYYFIGHVPEDVRALVPGGKSGQKWVSLKTADPAEAKRLGRLQSVAFDRELAVARKRSGGTEDRLTPADAERLAAGWLSAALGEDDEERREGFDARRFRQATEAADILDSGSATALARGDASMLSFEMEELLSIHGLNVPMGSEGWRNLGFAMLKAQRRWGTALRKRVEGEVVDTPAPPEVASAERSCTVQELIDAYLANPAKKRTAGTLKTYATVFRAMKELLGPDTRVSSIHRMDCERIRSVLMRLPPNVSQRFPGVSLEDAAAIADAKGLDRLGVAALNNYLHNLSALFKWGAETWRLTRNPAVGLALPDDRDARDARQPFSTKQLQAIFDAPLYRGCQNDEEGYAKPGPNVVRRGRFWVPLLSLWTGMRLGECCQLHVDDVGELGGVPVIFINDTNEAGGDEADRKRVKTEAGKRFVPIHPELQRIGFLKFAEGQRKKGQRRLFPELQPDALGYLSGPFSKFFNDPRRFLGKLGMAGTGVSFHSFRHCYRDALREAEMSLERVRALGGWRRDSDGEESTYGKGLKAETLYREIAKVSYPGLDFSHVYREMPIISLKGS